MTDKFGIENRASAIVLLDNVTNSSGALCHIALETIGVAADIAAESRFCPSIALSKENSEKLITQIDTLVANIPQRIAGYSAVAGSLYILTGRTALITLTGFGIASMSLGFISNSLLVNLNIRGTTSNTRARALMGLGISLSSLALVGKFNMFGLMFGLAHGTLCSSLALGLGPRVLLS